MAHGEFHRVHRIGWLRAAVLGANDGIVTMSSVILGIVAAGANPQMLVVTGVATLFAGALSMAAGEYVSVSSQSDTQNADLAKERTELIEQPQQELEELVSIYMERGLDQPLALKVATQMTANDALKAHARDELGIVDMNAARPVQAALVSAATFAVGALPPLLVAALLPIPLQMVGVVLSTIIFLAILGAVAAHSGGALMLRSVFRITLCGGLSMGITWGIGTLVGIVI